MHFRYLPIYSSSFHKTCLIYNTVQLCTFENCYFVNIKIPWRSVSKTINFFAARSLPLPCPNRLPNSMHTICSDRRCGMAIKLSYLLPFIVCSPTFLVFEILETKVVENGTVSTLYHLGLSTLARVNHELLYMIHLWTYAVIIKLLPCLILTVVTISLVCSDCHYLSLSLLLRDLRIAMSPGERMQSNGLVSGFTSTPFYSRAFFVHTRTHTHTRVLSFRYDSRVKCYTKNTKRFGKYSKLGYTTRMNVKLLHAAEYQCALCVRK